MRPKSRTVMKTRTFPSTRGRRSDDSAPLESQEELAGDSSLRKRVPPGTRYARIMQVSIGHTFYNSSRDQCLDFSCAPTPTTAMLMGSLGLLFKPELAGFSVLYDQAREQSLLQYLKRQEDKDGQNWTRLSFVLTPTNYYFVSRTRIPIGTHASRDNFYFTNQEAHWEEGANRPRLNPGRYVSVVSRLDVVNVQVAVPVTDDTRAVEVRDISGQVVLCRPRCIPNGLLEEMRPSQVTCGEVIEYLMKHPDAPMSCAQGVLYLDLDELPADRYTIVRCSERGNPADEAWTVVYDPMVPSPLCLIDLLLTNPNGASTGIYPVEGSASRQSIRPVHYELMFERRSTTWTYYIVPHEGDSLEGLHIIDMDAPCERLFEGPVPVKLANGASAYRFVSKKFLPLEQQSKVRLQLRGRRASLLNAPDILMERLPVASPQQVSPEKAQPALDAIYPSVVEHGSSDIYVYV